MTLATRVWQEPFLTNLRAMDGLFNRFVGMQPNGRAVTGFVPMIDVRETADDYVVWVDLPGVKREDVAIEFEGRVLTISGVRTPVETGETLRSERPYGSFTRTLTLPKGVDADRIAADYHDGVLELHIPKPADLKPKKIEIGGNGQKQLTS